MGLYTLERQGRHRFAVCIWRAVSDVHCGTLVRDGICEPVRHAVLVIARDERTIEADIVPMVGGVGNRKAALVGVVVRVLKAHVAARERQ